MRFRKLEADYKDKIKQLKEDIKDLEEGGFELEEGGKAVSYMNSNQRKQDLYWADMRFEDWLIRNKHSYQEFTGRQAMELAREFDLIRQNFVDSGLVNPDPGRRPLFYSDGRVRLFVLFQGYLSTFSGSIIKPILRNMAGRGSPQDQMNAAAVAMFTIFLGFLAQAIKDELKYGDRPTWLSDAEYFQRGIQASGLMGQTERAFNIPFPLYTSEEDSVADRAWAEGGALTGSIDTAAKAIEWAMEGEGERAINKALKLTPGIGVFTSLRQSTAKELAELFGE